MPKQKQNRESGKLWELINPGTPNALKYVWEGSGFAIHNKMRPELG